MPDGDGIATRHGGKVTFAVKGSKVMPRKKGSGERQQVTENMTVLHHRPRDAGRRP